MKAEDTVRRITDDDRRYLTGPQLAKLKRDRLAQAEISFNAGYEQSVLDNDNWCRDGFEKGRKVGYEQRKSEEATVSLVEMCLEHHKAGVREAVEWIVERYYAEPEDETFLGGIFIPDCDAEWQAKLEEWRIK